MKRISRIIIAIIALTLLLGVMVYASAADPEPSPSPAGKTKQWGTPSASFDATNVLLKITVAKGRSGTSYAWSMSANDASPTQFAGEIKDLAGALGVGDKQIDSAVTKATAGYVDISDPSGAFKDIWGKTIYIYLNEKATTDKGVEMTLSKPKAVAIPLRCQKGSGDYSGVDIDYTNEKLWGVGAGMQYKLDPAAKSWKKGTASTEKKGIALTSVINKLKEDRTILVRYAAVKGTSATTKTAASTMIDSKPLDLVMRSPDSTVAMTAARWNSDQNFASLTTDPNGGSAGFILESAISSLRFGTSASKLLRLEDIKVTGFTTGIENEPDIEAKLSTFLLSKAGKKIYVANAAIEPNGSFSGGFRSFPKMILVPKKNVKPKAGSNADYIIDFINEQIKVNTNKTLDVRKVKVIAEYDVSTGKVLSNPDYAFTDTNGGTWNNWESRSPSGTTTPVRINDCYLTVPKPTAESNNIESFHVEVRSPAISVASEVSAKLPSDPLKVGLTRKAAPNITIEFDNDNNFKGATKSMQYKQGADITACKASAWTDVTTAPISVNNVNSSLIESTSGFVSEGASFMFRLQATATALPSNTKEIIIDDPEVAPVITDFEFDYADSKLKVIQDNGATKRLDYQPQYKVTFASGVSTTAAWKDLPSGGADLSKVISDEIDAQWKKDPTTVGGSISMKISLRKKMTTTVQATPIDFPLITIDKAPDKSKFEFQYDSSNYVINYSETDYTDIEWKLSSASRWEPWGSDDYHYLETIAATSSAQKLQIRVKADGEKSRLASKYDEIVLPAMLSLANANLRSSDFSTSFITTDSDFTFVPRVTWNANSAIVTDIAQYCYRVGGDTAEWSRVSETGWETVGLVNTIDLANYSGEVALTLEVRKGTPESGFAAITGANSSDLVLSQILTITIPASSAAPTTPVFKENDASNGIITGLSTKMEYRHKDGAAPWSAWATVPAQNVQAARDGVIYEIRTKAVGSTPYSKSTSIKAPDTGSGPSVDYNDVTGKIVGVTTFMEWCILGESSYTRFSVGGDILPKDINIYGTQNINIRFVGATANTLLHIN